MQKKIEKKNPQFFPPQQLRAGVSDAAPAATGETEDE
jgi:hypothetical protein